MDQIRTIRYRRPSLKKYQLDAIFCPERFAFIEASTKSGKTYGSICWLAEQAFLTRKRFANFSWGAPSYQQAKIAYRRLRRYIPAALREPNDTELTLTLPNTARINFFTLEKPDNVFGDDDEASVIDEGSRAREEGYHAMLSRLTHTRGPMRVIGNVKGRKNWFYREARKAEAGEAGTHYARITAADAIAAGILKYDSIEDARARMPEAVFNELFNAIPNDDGGNPFGLAKIAACIAPLSSSMPVLHGVDLAKSVDFTVNIGLDYFGHTSTFDRFQRIPWPETRKRLLDGIGKRPTIVDSTGLGDPVVEEMQKESPGHIEGFVFTQKSKQQIIEGLAAGIQSEAVHYPDGPIRIELESFEYLYTRFGVLYAAMEGGHDDCVYALALAYSKFSGAHRAPPVSRWGGAQNGSIRRPSWHRDSIS